MPLTITIFCLIPQEIQPGEWAILGMVALFIGMAKTGVHGAGMMSIPVLANVFGGQLSSGIMLPILVMADLIGVWYYHRHASWKHLKRLFPWAAAGVVIGTLTGQFIDDALFRILMASIIYVSLGIMLWLEKNADRVPDTPGFAGASGVAGGFTSMVLNLANSVMAVYFLSVRLPKNIFIGTTAWFFLVLNWFKVPFHVWVWKTIDVGTVVADLFLIPLILVGAWIGIVIVKKFSDRAYRWFIIAMTAVSALVMIW